MIRRSVRAAVDPDEATFLWVMEMWIGLARQHSMGRRRVVNRVGRRFGAYVLLNR